jgi:hypothetical protein
MFSLSALRTNIPSPVSNFSADYSSYPSTPPSSPISYASTLFDGVDYLQYPMDIDTIQRPSSIHTSDLDSCRSTPPSSSLPPSLNQRQTIPLPLLDPEEEAEHTELEEFRKAREVEIASRRGRVSTLSKRVTAYVYNFLMDWLNTQDDEKNPIQEWDAKIAAQPSWTGATSSATLSPPSYKAGFEPLEPPGKNWIANPRSTATGLPFLLKHNGYLVEAPWVQYDYSPDCPRLLSTMGKDQPIQARPLVAQKTTDTANNYSACKMCLFDQDKPFTSWVEEALESENDPSLKAGIVQYRYSLFHEQESEQHLCNAMTDYSMLSPQRGFVHT